MKKDQAGKSENGSKAKNTRNSNNKSGKDRAGFSDRVFKKGGPASGSADGKKRPFWEAVAKKNPPVKPKLAAETPPEKERPAKAKPGPKPKPAAKHLAKPQQERPAPAPPKAPVKDPNEPMRLSKFVAHCGISARRQAGEYVKQGLVTVNGEVEKNPAYMVQPTDVVTFKGNPIKIEEKLVYILMNKPKDIITTASDEKGRKTVLDLIGDKVQERIFPVGRLDRMTTGLLLLTNDGDLAEKLSHPSHKVQKVYHVTLNKILNRPDFERLLKGVELEDGFVKVDTLHYAGERKNEVEVGLHIGKNRIVRRLFEHLGYEIEKLDRTYYAGLTKKEIGRGHFRHLTEKEVIMLKHFK
jgi:23S rRNA pseudouridine2605 synthase